MDGTNAGTAADNGEKPRYEVALTNQSFFNIICWVDRPNDSAPKRLMFQASFFFRNFLQNSLQKLFQFIFNFSTTLQK